MSYATLIDTTECVGCRSCQVSCKSWNDLKGEMTEIDGKKEGLQNPTVTSAKTWTVVTFSEVENEKAPGGLNYVFTKRQCMHCLDPACVSACPMESMERMSDGSVVNDDGKCIGCRYCVVACPFGAATAEWDSLAPKIKKCDMCHDRRNFEVAPGERNGAPTTEANQTAFLQKHAEPACVSQCPAGALKFGDRDELIKEARAKIAAHPDKYVDHIYGEKEAGGTAMLYLASVPFDRLGLPDVGDTSYPSRSAPALAAVPPAVVGVGAVLGGAYALGKRKEKVKQEARRDIESRHAKVEALSPPPVAEAPALPAPQQAEAHEHHPEFEKLDKPLWTPFNLAMLALMGLGGVSIVSRFALGLGASTGLSDTWAWGLWILFDLVWIAVAAGAFATAGYIYVMQRKDLYSIGRSAVLMGLLSYSFVMVTLMADLGLPWNAWQLVFAAPEHSAMFEVSWCVALYVTILALEFMPVPLQSLGFVRAMEAWKKWQGVYVVFAVSMFVYLMSRSFLWTGAAFTVFSVLAYAFRYKPGTKPVPVMLAIAAVTLSCMHQSSLGSLYLLMPDKLDHLWWSPVLPIGFLLSAVAAGTALIALTEMWVAKAWGRKLRMDQLATLGKFTLVALSVYMAFRVGDLVLRDQLGRIFTSDKSGLFLAEFVLGGLLPLALLSTRKLRENPTVLFFGTLLTTLGVVLHRSTVVVFGMNLRGAVPQIQPEAYAPSLAEWGISLGLIAATIFLFGLACRKFPVLPKEERA